MSFDERIPVICVSPSSVVGAQIFDPNTWSGTSKRIVQSCWAEFSVLHQCVADIVDLCSRSSEICQPQIEILQKQWATARFDLAKVVLFGEQPTLHMRIEAFFAGAKSLVDLMVQLLSAEMIVAGAIDGFHRYQGIYGQRVINSLQNNAPRDRKQLAEDIAALLNEHKARWLDELISARDSLVHPGQGMMQLMFRFECEECDGKLEYTQINPPEINSVPIDQYARGALGQVTSLASEFIVLIRRAQDEAGL